MEKYTETIRELLRRGLDVFSLDWRGQGRSTRMLPDPCKGFIRDYEEYIRDLECFFHHVVRIQATPPVIFLSHSMGAHITLRFLHQHSDMAERAILISPMIDITTAPYPNWFARWLCRSAEQTGFAHAYIPGSGHHSTFDKQFKGNRLTSDKRRFLHIRSLTQTQPDLKLGGITYAWLRATFQSIDILKRPGYASQINIPVRMVYAESDTVISVHAMKIFCKQMSECQCVAMPYTDVRHEILMERDEVRDAFWKVFDAFRRKD